VKQLLTTLIAICLAATVNAQQGGQSKPQPAPGAPPSPFAPTPVPVKDPVVNPVGGADESVNIRYEIRIREEGGPQPITKMVSMTATTHDTSLVRANQGQGNPLNVDVFPSDVRDGRVRTKLGLEYTPQTPPQMSKLSVRQNISVWLESGKPMVISQSADPMSDRRLTVEVTATILK
jgi:hypothetical protein